MDQYGNPDVGDLVTISLRYQVPPPTDPADLTTGLTDPTTLTIFVRDPQGVTAAYVYGTDLALVRDGLGVFHLSVLMGLWGDWTWRELATGAAASGRQGTWHVNQPLA